MKMKIKKLTYALLCAVMIIGIIPSAGAVSGEMIASDGLPEIYNTENSEAAENIIRSFFLNAEIYSGRTMKFTGTTECLEQVAEVGFTDIYIQKQISDGSWINYRAYGDDIEYKKSKCQFSYFYTGPLPGRYRICVCHYAKKGNFLFGYQIQRIFNYSNSVVIT